MPRSLEDILKHADELADRFERDDLPLDGDGHEHAITVLRAAVIHAADAEQELAQAVAAARSDGMPWVGIGLILGVSGEAARKRYGNDRALENLTNARER